MSAVWSFIQYQVLGMRWLDDLIGGLLTTLNVDIGTRLGGSAQFFLYDLIKIVILLVTLIFIISYIQTYYPPERTKQILSKIDGIKGNTVGALLGTVTPFCSCSSIPIFIGFTKAGLPLGVTFSFLISSPLVDFAALTILMSIFGVEVAVLYVIVGVIIAVIGGLIIEHMHMEDQIADSARRQLRLQQAGRRPQAVERAHTAESGGRGLDAGEDHAAEGVPVRRIGCVHRRTDPQLDPDGHHPGRAG